MNIFWQEFKSLIRSVLIWSASMSILIAAFMAVFPSFAADSQALEMIIENYPQELLDAFGMSGVDLSTVAGYFSMTFLFVQLCAAVQASNYGFSSLSAEERDRTADFLFTRPVKRIHILTAKILSSVSALILTNLILFPISLLLIELFKEERNYDRDIMCIMLASMLLFQLIFLATSMFISMLVIKVRNVLSFSIGLSFFMYILSVFENISGIGVISYISPFKQLDAGALVQNGSYDHIMVIVGAVMIIISIAATFLIYEKRDIHSIS